MKIFVSLLPCLIVVVFCIGCSDDPPVPEPKPTIQQIFPMKVGDIWVYQRNTIQTGTVDSSTYRFVSTDSSLINSRTYTLEIDGDTTKSGGLYFVGTSDLYSVSFSKGITTMKHLLQYPMEFDNNVLLDYHIRASDFMRIREDLILRQDTTTVATPLGTFHCVYFENVSYMGPTDSFQDTTGIVGLYYAKNIGLVKREEYDYVSGKRVLNRTLQLVSYSLK